MEKSIQLLPGARATEAYLLGCLAKLQAESQEDPSLLRAPIRILVPSSSLRMHLSERIAKELGAMLGVQIQTLQGLAVNIVELSGQEPHRSNALVDVLCRRAAQNQDALRQALEGFEDGLQGLTGVVRDLFDAGFEQHSGEALQELIDEAPLSQRSRRRARCLLKVAMEVEDELAKRATGGRAALYRQAAECLADSSECLPTRALFVHGFADVTGRANDLLQRLVRLPNTRVLLDQPRDPLDSTRAPERGIEFTERLLGPLEGILGQAESCAQEPPISTRAHFSAPGRHSEVREVARRIRGLLDQGARPERIGIVARDPGPYGVALRRQLKMLAIPFSAPGLSACIDAPARRILALLQLFEEGLRCPVDRWFDALGATATLAPLDSNDKERAEHPSASQMLMGLRVTGAGRLGDVLRVNADDYLGKHGDLTLPLPTGAQTAADQEGEGARYRAPERRLAGAHLSAWIQRAKHLADHLQASAQEATAQQHLEHFASLRQLLDWSDDEPAALRCVMPLQSLVQGLGEELVSGAEFRSLLAGKLKQAALPTLGARQAGAGVQVLDVMEARGRTFEQLFLIGLNRDVFPRTIGTDALFPDEVRVKIEAILPDIPILARGRLEDRYLFAQLLSAGKQVTLSWQHSGEDGKPRMLSPLVERLFDQAALEAVFQAPTRFPMRPGPEHLAAPRDAHEQAILGALHGSPADFEAHLNLALEEIEAFDSRPLADLRTRVLSAFENTRERGLNMSPWLGFLGTQEELGVRPDPRQEAPYVTRIEGISRCPWQTVLTRLLRLKPTPDPLDELPGISPLTLGNIVHNVLCRIDQRVLGKASMELSEAIAREPQQADWPLQEEFERILMEEAHEQAKLHFEPIPGLVRVLAECTRPFLKAAEELRLKELKQHMGSRAGVLGAEVDGRARFTRANGEALELLFKADRVERQGSRIVVSDYKTGAFKSESKLKGSGIPQADQLQPMAYILAALEEAEEVSGRYLYLGARAQKKEVIEVGLDQDSDDQIADFKQSIGTVVDAWVAGTFFPRMTRADNGQVNKDCEHCEVKEACLQGDSAAREAMTSWGQPWRQHPAAQAASDLWQLRTQKRLKKKVVKGENS